MSIKNIDINEIIDHLPVGVFRSSLGVKASFLYTNKAFCNMFGIKKKDVAGVSVKCIFSKAKEFGDFYKLIRKEGSVRNVEILLRKKDGTAFWGAICAVVGKDKGKKVSYVDVTIDDISRQKAYEQGLNESKGLFQTVFNNMAAAIMVVDKEEKIVAWNPFAEDLLHMGKAELFNMPVQGLYPPEEWRKIRDIHIRALGSRHHLETKVITKKRRVIDVSLSVGVLKDENGVMSGSVGIMQDITEQKLVKEMLLQSKLAAEQANRSKSLFLANMSHEVRTPMNTIMGMLDLTLETSMNQEQRENLNVAKDAADNLLNLLNDILDISRVEAGKITLESIDLNLHNVVNNVCKGLAVIAKAKDLEVVADIDSSVPKVIVGDPVRLRQILINLINNAIKFTSKGKIIVGIRLSANRNDKVTLHFSVQDQGIGIPKDRQEKIFDIFTQADDSTTRKFGGTGLGLAISKRLVEMMGGKIWVESSEGQGSIFHFTGRFKTVEYSTQNAGSLNKERALDEELLKEKLNGLHILLAEDNIVNQKIAARILEKQGCHVEAVENGQQVLDSLEKKHFDVILMDAQMPVMNGFESTICIRKKEKGTGRHIPIIALTARAMQDDRQKCVDVGMDGYVAKPIDRKKLFYEIGSMFTKER